MRAAVDEDRPIERTHELQAVADDFAGDRIQVFEDAGTADAAPLMRRGVWPALILRRAPDGFRCGVGAHSSGLVEREAKVICERRLAGILGAIDAPLTGNVRRPGTLRRHAKADDGGEGERDKRDRCAHKWGDYTTSAVGRGPRPPSRRRQAAGQSVAAEPIALMNAAIGTGLPCTGAIVATSRFNVRIVR